MPYSPKHDRIYSANCTLKKGFGYVIMPKVVTKGYKVVIISYINGILINSKSYERQTIFYDKKQN